MPSHHPARIRLGAVAFLLSGLLIVIATILRGPFIDPSANHVGFAHWVTSAMFFPAAVGFLLSLVLQIFGIFTLYAFLASSSVERLALVGLILTVVTDALLIAVVGTFAFIFPTIGTLYLQGQQQVIEVAVTFGTSFMVVLLAQAILFSLAVLITSVAVWRSGTLPKWSALTYALAGLILAFAPYPRADWHDPPRDQSGRHHLGHLAACNRWKASNRTESYSCSLFMKASFSRLSRTSTVSSRHCGEDAHDHRRHYRPDFLSCR